MGNFNSKMHNFLGTGVMVKGFQIFEYFRISDFRVKNAWLVKSLRKIMSK